MKKILDKAHDDRKSSWMSLVEIESIFPMNPSIHLDLAQMNVLLDHTSKLEDTRKTLDKEHQEEELIWRKKLSKVGTEVKNAVVRYDTEMNQNKEQLHSLQASFHAEQDEFAQLSEYFQKVSADTCLDTGHFLIGSNLETQRYIYIYRWMKNKRESMRKKRFWLPSVISKWKLKM